MLRLISGSSEPVIIENGSLYLKVAAPAFFVLGLINDTRTALQAIGSKVLPLFSSVIELIGKILFVSLLVPRFQYLAVVFCEPVIWCFMAVELVDRVLDESGGEGGCLCQWGLKVPTDRSRSDCLCS